MPLRDWSWLLQYSEGLRLDSNFMITFSLPPKAWVSLITSLSEIPPCAVPPRQRQCCPRRKIGLPAFDDFWELTSVNEDVRTSIDRKVRHSNCFCCGQSSPNSFRSNFGWIHLLAFFVTVFNWFPLHPGQQLLWYHLQDDHHSHPANRRWVVLEFLRNWSESTDSSKVGFKSHIIVFKSCCGCNCITSGGNGFDEG